MKPVHFPQANKVYTAPDGMKDCSDLPAHTHDGGILSCWELSDAELETIKKTRRIFLNVCGKTQPPVWLSTDVFEESTPETTMPAPVPEEDQIHSVDCAFIVKGTECDCPRFKNRLLN